MLLFLQLQAIAYCINQWYKILLCLQENILYGFNVSLYLICSVTVILSTIESLKALCPYMGIPSGKSTLKRVLKACCITDLFLTVMGLTAAQADTGLYAITYSVTKTGAAYRIVKHSPHSCFLFYSLQDVMEAPRCSAISISLNAWKFIKFI